MDSTWFSLPYVLLSFPPFFLSDLLNFPEKTIINGVGIGNKAARDQECCNLPCNMSVACTGMEEFQPEECSRVICELNSLPYILCLCM